MFCPKCQKVFSVQETIINLQNLPVDVDVKPRYCPMCGTKVDKEEKENERMSKV